jgi:hypothetical protein
MKTKINLAVPLIAILVSSCTGHTDLAEEYWPDGTIKSETQMKNGMRNGYSKTYDERGRLKSTAEFVDDQYQGWMINYNPENGKITAKAYYENDTQNGPLTLYYRTGELYREEYYVKGRVDSIVKTYWADGNLQAEVDFDMGAPAVGLKEFDQNGNSIQQPHIVIEEINQLALLNTFKLRIYLSDHNTDVDFYQGDLIDNKYFNKYAVKIRDKDGVAMLQYNILRHHTLTKHIGIIARARTARGNTLLLYKSYNLAISN